jgi:hypothetical protein
MTTFLQKNNGKQWLAKVIVWAKSCYGSIKLLDWSHGIIFPLLLVR